MQKINAIIYIPIGMHNAGSNNEELVARLIQKQIPQNLKLSSIIKVDVEEQYSTCAVELEEFVQETTQKIINNNDIEYDEILKFIDTKMKNSKNSKSKNELEDIKKFITELKIKTLNN